MLFGFPRSSLASPCLVIVVQHTSISTKFTNNTWRYVGLYVGVTRILHGAHVGYIPTRGEQTTVDSTVQHHTIHVPEEGKGTGGRRLLKQYRRQTDY
jgi:hypothetical protein